MCVVGKLGRGLFMVKSTVGKSWHFRFRVQSLLYNEIGGTAPIVPVDVMNEQCHCSEAQSVYKGKRSDYVSQEFN